MTAILSRCLALTLVLLSTPALAQTVTGLPDFTGLVEQAGPAVVNIRVAQFGERAQLRGNSPDPNQPFSEEDMEEFFRRFFDERGVPRFNQPDRIGAGSGFIIEEDGYVVTNHHVVADADEIIVRLADRREYEAELIGSDEYSDIALLKIDARNLPTLEWGSSRELRRGQWVVAIGSPFNFDQSVTAGIVSAKGRSNNAQQYVPFIQTDVAINRGNSGGPLLDMDGRVVGINSWILSSTGGYIGLSFSIPVEVARSAIEQLRTSGRVARGLLGVQVGIVDRAMAEAMNLDRPIGALVNDVSPGSAAETAGIEPGDVILEVDGEPIEVWSELPPVVGANPPGTELDILVSRNGEKMEFTVTLDELNAVAGGPGEGSEPEARRSNLLGLAVESISPEQRRALGDVRGGVMITDVESDDAWRVGVRPGDVLLTVNNREINGLDDFEDIVEDLEPGRAVAIRVLRDGQTQFLAYTPETED